MADYDLQYQDTYIDALLATANELKTAGYIYKGVATPSTNPGTPTERVAYLASEPGTYTNFGGIVIASGLYSLTYAGGTWTGTQMQAGSDIEVVQTTGQSTSNVMSQKAVTDKVVIGENIDYISQTQYFDFFIAGNSPYKWTAKSSTLKYACRILPISTNASYKITAANNNPTHYALLRNNTPQVNVVATDWNGGAPRTLRAGESVQINTGEYTYLYVRNNTDSTTSDFKYPKEIELIKSVNSTVQEMQGSLTEVVDNVGEWNEKKGYPRFINSFMRRWYSN